MKIPVPNLSANNHVSRDFRLAYGNLNNYLERIEDEDPPRSRFLAKRSFLHRNIPRYEEFFSPETYADVVNENNQDVVARINLLVDQLNDCRGNEWVEYETLAPLRNALDQVVIGELHSG